MMIEPILGIGELAISDHRSSKPTDAELARIASEARLGGMLSGKAGVVNVHLGDAPAGFEPLERIVAPGDLPRTQFLPTHCNRNPIVLEQSVAWTLAGGYADYTTSTVPRFLEEGEDPGVALGRELAPLLGEVEIPQPCCEVRHAFLRTRVRLLGFLLDLPEEWEPTPGQGTWWTLEEAAGLPASAGCRKLLERLRREDGESPRC